MGDDLHPPSPPQHQRMPRSTALREHMPGARSILHKSLRQRKLVFKWVLYGLKGRNLPGTCFFLWLLPYGGAIKLVSPLELITNMKVVF